ncbi:2,3-bisphosphoglycerate-dependent phosphoglycerate mutase [Nitriliruptor alkaliphilus]|uniref:2,3-bisphosphoglycerate-dependent phosphoglycerate mutase n=1 Tax=Nitriliruptor alkaliphilus TaxID=427918 RepID=UPI00069799CB|nr:2,3-diphosphoglycerate-dependent phosphoglycerate mutase [Nitriliruptor alkaliphilus]
MPTLAIVRHGQSLWNLENRFTGWVDVPLTEKGRDEARLAGERLRGQHFDVAYTSSLIRAQDTLRIIIEHAGLEGLPVIRDEALNERHYGDLQGLNKADTAAKYGDEQVKIWRRSFATPPPNGEALKDTAARTLPFFDRAIMGDIRQGKDVLVVAHGNSNRSIVMQLDELDEDGVLALELATGIPLVYELDEDGTVRSRQLLTD